MLRDKFIKDNPNTSRKLIEGISRAIEWAQTTPPEEVRARFERIIAERKRNEDRHVDQVLEEHRCIESPVTIDEPDLLDIGGLEATTGAMTGSRRALQGCHA